jgi:hypothetical protein
MLVSMFAMSASAVEYKDVAGTWGESSITRWSDSGIVEGRENGLFAPNATLTRAEAATIFVRLLGLTEIDSSISFTDVPADAWYADAVYKCATAGIVEGVGGGKYSPLNPIKREDMFKIFALALNVSEADTMNRTYADGDDIDSWAVGYVNALVNLGYIQGISATKMAPQNSINRASMMKLLDNAISDYITEDGTYAVEEATTPRGAAETKTLKGTGIILIRAKNVTLKGKITGTIVVSQDDAKLDLSGVTAPVSITIRNKNVELVDVPEGSTVTVGAKATGAVVNGEEVKPGTTITVEEDTGDNTTGDTTTGDATTGNGTTGDGTTGDGTTGNGTTGDGTTGNGTTGDGTTGNGTTGNGTTGNGTTGNGTTGNGTTGNGTTGNGTTGNGTPGNGTTGNGTTGNGTTGNGTTGNGTTGNGTTGNGTTGNGTTGNGTTGNGTTGNGTTGNGTTGNGTTGNGTTGNGTTGNGTTGNGTTGAGTTGNGTTGSGNSVGAEVVPET